MLTLGNMRMTKAMLIEKKEYREERVYYGYPKWVIIQEGIE